jgi:hypothetical protein
MDCADAASSEVASNALPNMASVILHCAFICASLVPKSTATTLQPTTSPTQSTFPGRPWAGNASILPRSSEAAFGTRIEVIA